MPCPHIQSDVYVCACRVQFTYIYIRNVRFLECKFQIFNQIFRVETATKGAKKNYQGQKGRTGNENKLIFAL